MKKLKAGDLFCGFGGTTEGMLQSELVDVVWAINHDPKAIEAHEKNHPHVKHYMEDIVEMDETLLEPVDILWASLECTHFSGAKGGQDRDPDSRMMADELIRYIVHCDPMYVMIENVREFTTWGPLKYKLDSNGNRTKDKNGRYIRVPDQKRKSEYYHRWINAVKSMGYEYRSKLLNSADYGAYTARSRYFGIFAKKGLPIKFPSQTHTKTEAEGYQKWKPVKEILDLDDEGNSIFGRKKQLAESTLKRIAHGIMKHVIKKDEMDFIMKYYGNGENLSGVNQPLHTITTKDRHAKVSVEKHDFITQHFHGSINAQSVDTPLGTIITKDLKQKISVDFISNQNFGTNHKNNKSIDEPLPTQTTQERMQKVSVEKYIASYYGTTPNGEPRTHKMDMPLPTVVTANRHSMVSVEKRQFIQRFFSGEHNHTSVDSPLGSILTNNKDALTTINLLDYMIVDVKMRFLHTHELAKAQGFPENYYLGGTKKEQIKYVGNSVVPQMGKLLAESNIKALNNEQY